MLTQPSECPVISRRLAPDLGTACYEIKTVLTGVLYPTDHPKPSLPCLVKQSPGSIAVIGILWQKQR